MNLSRHIEVFNPSAVNNQIHIIGVGATGSFVAMQLARMGVREMYLYDFDSVELHNIPNQYYDNDDIGKTKVQALADKLEKINPELLLHLSTERVTPNDIKEMSGYLFLLVDSMETRKELFIAALENKNNFIQCWESRLGSDQGRVYCIPMKEARDSFDYMKYLNKHFYKDSDAEMSACGTSITVLPIVLMTASLMIAQFIKVVMGDDKEPYINNFTLFDNMYNAYVENFYELDMKNKDDVII